MRTDQLDARRLQAIPQRITVRGPVVDESRALLVENTFFQQRLDRTDVGSLGTVDRDPPRQTLTVDLDEQLGSLAFLGLADRKAPFFAGANVASAIATLQSSSPSRSSFLNSRSQTWANHFQIQSTMRLLYYYPDVAVPLIVNRIVNLQASEDFFDDCVRNGLRANNFVDAIAWSENHEIKVALAGLARNAKDDDLLDALRRAGMDVPDPR